MEKEFKTFLNSLTADTTYVVSEDCSVSTPIHFPQNVTLIFKGGIISTTTTGILIGNNTCISASISKIFDIDLKYEGTWIFERAYPQWFGAQTNNPDVDSSRAINAAILFKKVGEVFLPKGIYYINNHITIIPGIILTGDGFGTEEEEHSTTLTPQNSNFWIAAQFKFMIVINITDGNYNPLNATWINTCPLQLTTIRYISFKNKQNIPNMRGILFGGKIDINHCNWEGYIQAISSCYSLHIDGKRITFCNFTTPNQESEEYAFDLSGLGDSLCFRDNSTGSNHHDYNMVRIDLSNGADISNNVICGNVLIKRSKAVNFNSNHFKVTNTVGESYLSPQFSIINSNVQVTGNYFRKGEVPIVKITGDAYFNCSSVTLLNNLFLQYLNEHIRGNEFDIETDGYASIKIINSFRYCTRKNYTDTMLPSGLLIKKSSGDAFEEFNCHSYFLSNDAEIKPVWAINMKHSVTTGESFDISYVYNNVDKWNLSGSMAYTYTYYIFWDIKRNIQMYSSPQSINAPNNDGSSNLSRYFTIVGPNAANDYGLQTILRLVRNDSEYVDIPLCGTKFLSDNGNAVNGYIWKENIPIMNNPINPIGSIEYTGQNIILKANNVPTSGSWKKGDIVINAGTSALTHMWISQGSTPSGTTNWIVK